MSSRTVLRPYLPSDAPAAIEIFRASIEELTTGDYSEAQRQAWIAAADDEKAFIERIARHLTLFATIGGKPAGFASLEDNERIDFLYVHPSHAGQGIAAMLVDALEKLAANRGARQLTVEASDTALGFFQKRGYLMKQRNSMHRNGEWLANTTMEKELAAAAPSTRTQ